MRPVTSTSFRSNTGRRSMTGGVGPMPMRRNDGIDEPTLRDFKISARPVTAGGLAGVDSIASGGGQNNRRIHDSAYFESLLRSKIDSIAKEISRIESESKILDDDCSKHGQYERVHDNLAAEIENLRHNVSDCGIAMDHLRNRSDSQQITRIKTEISSQNRKYGEDLDNAFIQRNRYEEEADKIEHQMVLIYKRAEEMVMKTDLVGHKSFMSLSVHSEQLGVEIHAQEKEIKRSQTLLLSLDKEARSKQLRDELKLANFKANAIANEVGELTEEVRITRLNPAESHDVISARTRSLQERIRSIDALLSTAEHEKKENEQKTAKLQMELLANTQRSVYTFDDYSSLVAKNAELRRLLDTGYQTKNDTVNHHELTRSTIKKLLELISVKATYLEQTLPSPDEYQELKTQAMLKEKHLSASEHTVKRLLEQKNQREKELKQVQSVDDHIKMELCKLQSSIKKMSGETRIFEDIDALHAKSESTKAFLSQLTTEYRDRTESVESKAQLIELKLDKDRRILDKKPTWKKLVALEEKLSAQKQCIHELRDKVSTKRRATDFDSLKDSCAYLVDRMNNAAIQNLVVQNPEWQQ